MSDRLKPAERAILQHAMLNLSANTIAQRTGIATSTVRDVLAQHGDDLGGWQAALDADSDATPAPRRGDVDPYEVEVAPRPGYTDPGRVKAAQPSLSALLVRAGKGDARSKRLAERIKALVKDLDDHLAVVEAKYAKAEGERAARAAAVAEVKRLEAELAAARKKAGKPHKDQRGDSAAIRAWAKDQGLEVGPVGRVPEPIVAAYEEAHR